MATVRMNAATGSDSASATKRRGFVASLAIHTTQGSCDILDCREVDVLAIRCPAGVTGLTAYGAATEGGIFELINDFGTGGTLAVTAAQWATLANLAPYPFIQLKSAGATGTATVVGK